MIIMQQFGLNCFFWEMIVTFEMVIAHAHTNTQIYGIRGIDYIKCNFVSNGIGINFDRETATISAAFSCCFVVSTIHSTVSIVVISIVIIVDNKNIQCILHGDGVIPNDLRGMSKFDRITWAVSLKKQNSQNEILIANISSCRNHSILLI